MKVVINKRYGGFELSLLAKSKLRKLGVNPDYVTRDDPRLVAIVERLGPKANGSYAELQIVEIPDNVKWTIEEYDGVEWVAEIHRTWR